MEISKEGLKDFINQLCEEFGGLKAYAKECSELDKEIIHEKYICKNKKSIIITELNNRFIMNII